MTKGGTRGTKNTNRNLQANRRMADWYFGSYPQCSFEKYLVKTTTKVQLIDTIEKALFLVFKDLRILSNSLSLRLTNAFGE